MVLDAVSNFVRGRADAQLTAGATTLSVEDASIFPDPATDGEYNVVIWDANNFPRPDQDGDVEIVRVTGRDTGSDELTVVRAQETTSDVAHPEGSAVHLSPTAKMFSDIEAEYTAQGENFDGQGTSEFENLQSLSTENLLTKSVDGMAVNGDFEGFGTLQDAVTFAETTPEAPNRVVFSQDSGRVDIRLDGFELIGIGRPLMDASITNDNRVVDIDADGVLVSGFVASSRGSAATIFAPEGDKIRARDIQFTTTDTTRYSFRMNTGIITQCDFTESATDDGDIRIDGDNSVVVANRNLSALDDRGTGTEVSSNS